MKTRGIIILLILALAISAAGCRPAEQTVSAHPDFAVQYIRTNGYHNGRLYPIVSVVETKAELAAYYEINRGDYDLERNQNPSSDFTIGFQDAIDRYDDAFFTDKLLVLVLLEEGSGSIRHLAKEIFIDNDNMNILIERQVPQVGTADMAEWHIIFEIRKSEYHNQNIKVYFSVKRAEIPENG